MLNQRVTPPQQRRTMCRRKKQGKIFHDLAIPRIQCVHDFGTITQFRIYPETESDYDTISAFHALCTMH